MSLSQTQLGINCPITVTNNSLIAAVMKEAMCCKEYVTMPRNANIIFDKITELYIRDFEHVGLGGFYIKYFNTCKELDSWLEDNLLSIPEIIELNLRQREYNLGYRSCDVIGDNRPNFQSGDPDLHSVEEDFVCLGAFVRNVGHNIIRDNVDIDFSTFK